MTSTTSGTTSITVGTATAAPGESATGRIEVTALAGGASVGIPVIVVNGVREGPCLWVDGAIHGDEPEGTLMCQLLRREVDPRRLAGSLVLAPVMNTGAFEAGRRGNPLDTFSYDMNRIYPGRPNGYLTERVAHAHKEWLVAVADMNIAVHSGGEHSYLSEMIFVTDHPGSQELARAMGEAFSLVLKTPRPSGNPMGVMLAAGRSGITVELGGRSATSPEAFRRVGRTLADGALNVMRHYRMIPGEPRYAALRHKGVQEALLAPASGLFLPEPGVGFQEPMSRGDVIARIHDVFGEEAGVISAPADGMVFGLRCLPSVMTGDWCCFYAKLDGTWDD